MAFAKKGAIDLIEKLPDDHSYDEIIAELYFKQQIEQCLRDIEEGMFFGHEQIKNLVLQWWKSSGRI
jgi:predicted transcriptional regulator